MFDDLKARLGFGSRDGQDDRDYDDYDDYDDGYSNRYDDEFEGYGDDSDDGAVGGFRPISTSSSRSSRSSSRADSGPRLVSIDDVKATTPLPDRYGDSESTTSRYGGRTVLDETVPPVSSPAHNAALRDSHRSEGVDSLFDSTSSSPSFSAYASSSNTTTTYTTSRSLTVIKPTIYGDVERVAHAVKLGDVVVLVMRSTPEDLSKRILDFSFGVASALDANVECPGDKVFAIARGNGLTEDEKRRLRNQGAL